MDLNNVVFELDGESGNFAWYVKRYIDKQVEEKFTFHQHTQPAILLERVFECVGKTKLKGYYFGSLLRDIRAIENEYNRAKQQAGA